MSPIERIRLNGIRYIIPFLDITSPLIALVAISLILRPTFKKCLLTALPLSMLAYTVYVGGDAFHDWRFLAPYVPYAFLVLLFDFPYLINVIRNSFISRYRYWGILIFSTIAFFTIGRPPFIDYLKLLMKHPSPNNPAIANINTAIYLNHLLKKTASVGVFYAGAIPYYTELYAVDFLGKCDPYIASLEPDKSGKVAFTGQKSVPGHNKYDLQYSILKRKPTYVAGLKWGGQDVTEAALVNYARIHVNFTTWNDDDFSTIFLLKDSPDIKWNELDIMK